MSASNQNREQLSNLSQVTRRPTAAIDADAALPRFSRVLGDIALEVPEDCDASVIFKCVGHTHSGGDIYAFWLVVGRYGEATMTVSYHGTDGDIRCDLPSGGVAMSSAALQPQLAVFLATNQLIEGEPPILVP